MRKLAFYQISRTRWANQMPFGIVDEIMVGDCVDEQYMDYEFGIRFSNLDNKVVARVEIYSDALRVLRDHPELAGGLAFMHRDSNVADDPSEWCQMLLSLGCEDHSETRCGKL